MAVNKAKIFTITSVCGGTGKTTAILCMAGIFANMKKKVLLVDLDLYKGTIASSLNLDVKGDVFKLVDDLNNNNFKTLEDYTTTYNEYIDVLPVVKDPRYANKINAGDINLVFDKYIYKYDIIFVDTASNFSPINLVTFDYSDLIVYVINNDAMGLVNMRSAVSIFESMKTSKYRILLNEATDCKKKYLSLKDVEKIIKAKIDYHVYSDFYIKEIDKYVLSGLILTFDPIIRKKYRKQISGFEIYVKKIVDEIEAGRRKELQEEQEAQALLDETQEKLKEELITELKDEKYDDKKQEQEDEKGTSN